MAKRNPILTRRDLGGCQSCKKNCYMIGYVMTSKTTRSHLEKFRSETLTTLIVLCIFKKVGKKLRLAIESLQITLHLAKRVGEYLLLDLQWS